jgi:hypothetical protein
MATRTSPTAMPNLVHDLQVGLRARERAVAALARRIAFPRVTQWPIDPPALTYRCGGSAGMVLEERTGFPFDPSPRRARDTRGSKL